VDGANRGTAQTHQVGLARLTALVPSVACMIVPHFALVGTATHAVTAESGECGRRYRRFGLSLLLDTCKSSLGPGVDQKSP
jgi:hypothetical protein